MTAKLLDAEEALTKSPETDVSEIVGKVTKAFEKCKDKTFGKLFSKYVVAEDAAGDLLTIKAALHLDRGMVGRRIFQKDKTLVQLSNAACSRLSESGPSDPSRPKLHNIMRGGGHELRRRDGFKLTTTAARCATRCTRSITV